jgi:hypothetical protein
MAPSSENNPATVPDEASTGKMISGLPRSGQPGKAVGHLLPHDPGKIKICPVRTIHRVGPGLRWQAASPGVECAPVDTNSDISLLAGTLGVALRPSRPRVTPGSCWPPSCSGYAERSRVDSQQHRPDTT